MLDDLFEIIGGIIHGYPRLTRLPGMMLAKANRGTDLGWIWSILKPMLYLVMFYAAMNMGFKSSKNIDGVHCVYFVWLATGIMSYRYIQALLTGGATCFTRQSILIKNSDLPLSVYPLMPVISEFYIHVIMMVIVVSMAVLSGAKISIHWIQLPFFMFVSMCFVYVWSFIWGMLHVVSKDFINIIRAIQPAFFWLSGIFFNSRTRHSVIFTYNPITFIAEGYRDALCYNAWFWQRMTQLKGFIVVMTILLLTMLLLYGKLKDRIVELV